MEDYKTELIDKLDELEAKFNEYEKEHPEVEDVLGDIGEIQQAVQFAKTHMEELNAKLDHFDQLDADFRKTYKERFHHVTQRFLKKYLV